MPARAAIDLNSDLGEGFGIWKMGDDDELLRIISSANVACGYHAGDASIMRATCRQALELGVNVGAHVGYADRAGFGRREIVMTPEAVYADVAYQIGALVGCATSVGAQVTYVKPHGALYNRAYRDESTAEAIVEAIRAIDPALVLLGQAEAKLSAIAVDRGLQTVDEAFIDRAYAKDGSLVSRAEPDAVLQEDAAVAQALEIALRERAPLREGGWVPVKARSLCIHSDTPGAARLAATVRQRLLAEGLAVTAFA